MTTASFIDELRARDRGRYLSALLARDTTRRWLIGLYAFDCELLTIPVKVGEPMLAHIRLQWWHDTITGLHEGAGRSHPIVATLEQIVGANLISVDSLVQVIEARVALLGQSRPQNLTSLCERIVRGDGLMVALAGNIVAHGSGEKLAGEACQRAGMAWGLSRLICDLRSSSARELLPTELIIKHNIGVEQLMSGTVSTEQLRPILADIGTEVQRQLSSLKRDNLLPTLMTPAWAHLASLGPLLNQLTSSTHNPISTPIYLSPVRLQWRIMRASLAGLV